MSTTTEQLRRTRGELMQTLAGLESLHRFQENLDIAATRDELADQLLKRMRTFNSARLAGLFLVDEGSLEFVLDKALPKSAAPYLAEEFDLQVEAEVLGWVVNQRKAVVVQPRSPRAAEQQVRSLVFVPLIASFQTLGLFLLGADVDERDVGGESLQLLAMAGKQFALALRNQSLYDNLWKEKINLQVAHDEMQQKLDELERTREQLQAMLHEVRLKTTELEHLKGQLEQKVEERTRELVQANQELNRLSNVDPLTGVYNRRHLEEAMAQENERGKRYGVRSSILIFDLDGLKRINDRFGHLMGDIALKEAAHLLQRTARRTDIVARFGGDEFVVVTPHTAEVGNYIRRLQVSLTHWNAEHSKDGFELSMSVGFATSGKDLDLFAALQKADAMMYEEKRAKR